MLEHTRQSLISLQVKQQPASRRDFKISAWHFIIPIENMVASPQKGNLRFQIQLHQLQAHFSIWGKIETTQHAIKQEQVKPLIDIWKLGSEFKMKLRNILKNLTKVHYKEWRIKRRQKKLQRKKNSMTSWNLLK